MYSLIFAIILSSGFSSKRSIRHNNELKKSTVYPKVEGFYYPVVSFDKLKEKDNSYNFYFLGKKEVYPVRKGIVLFVGKDKTLPGYTVVLHHSPNYISFYSNLEEVKIIKGDLLKNIFHPIGITNKNLIFSLRRSSGDNITEKIDIKKVLKRRDNYNKT